MSFLPIEFWPPNDLLSQRYLAPENRTEKNLKRYGVMRSWLFHLGQKSGLVSAEFQALQVRAFAIIALGDRDLFNEDRELLIIYSVQLIARFGFPQMGSDVAKVCLDEGLARFACHPFRDCL